MEFQKIKTTFEKKGYTLNSYIDKKQYLRLINSLMVHDPQYLDQVAQELWVQAAGEHQTKDLRIIQIINTIIQAQNILRDKIKSTKQEISVLQGQKRRLQINPTRQQIRKVQEINQQLNQIYAELESFQQDYKLVTQPFGISKVNHLRTSNSPNRNNYSPAGLPHQPSYLQQPNTSNHNSSYQTTDGYIESQQLKLMLFCTLIFGALEIIMIYGKSDFLNLIVLVCLLSIYLMNFFDRTYIRLTLSLVIISIILDFVWLAMYAGPKWSPSQVSNNTIYQIGYMRFIVFFTIVLIPIKIGMFFFLFQHKNAQTNQKYSVSIGQIKIQLSTNISNPISKGLTNISNIYT